jgi:murein DD-endopeptidase MepM/ murein hydrolase activator NlpD
VILTIASSGTLPSLLVLAKRKYQKNYVKKVKTDSGEVRVYDEAHVKKRWKQKIDHLNSLKKNLPKLQKKYTHDLGSDDPKVCAIAAAVAILDLTAMRIGNDGSVDEFGTFGATTLKKKHVKVSGSKVSFSFLGKKQVAQKFSFSNAKVASVIKALLAGKSGNDFLFEYDDGHRVRAKVVNRYLADFDITAKDLRGFHANRLMRDALKKTKDFDKALDQVAEEVGHESKTLMNQYLDPALVSKYKKASSDQFSMNSYISSGLSRIFGKSPVHSVIPAAAPAAAPAHNHEPARERSESKNLAGGQRVTSHFGDRIHPITGKLTFHGGIDLAAKVGDPVYAIAPGVVVKAGAGNKSSGIMIHLAHGPKRRTESLYLHLSEVSVGAGDSVVAGQMIGRAGRTGAVTGPHLHLILKHNGQSIDPAKYLEGKVVVGK